MDAAYAARNRSRTDKFWAGIRDYYKRYRDSNASAEETSDG